MENKFQTPVKFKRRGEPNRKPLTIPPSPFLEKLGYGTGVTVWKLQHSPNNKNPRSPWAIKNVRSNINKQLSIKYQSLLNKEATILESLNHENIIGFKDYIKCEDGRYCLAMEVGGESLGNLIEARYLEEERPYPAKIILKVAYDIAKALKYLHEEKKLLHGDIKTYNVIIKNDFDEVKLCDFGVSVRLQDDVATEKYVGTPIYSAPECQEGAEGPVTSKADIFSFGLVLWEMISLVPPHVEDLLFDESVDSILDESGVESSVYDCEEFEENYGTRPSLPDVDLGPEYGPVLELFYHCTEQNPEKRPTAAQLVDSLKELLK